MGTKASLPSGDPATSWPVIPFSGTEAITVPDPASTIASARSPFCATSSRAFCATAEETAMDTTIKDPAKQTNFTGDLASNHARTISHAYPNPTSAFNYACACHGSYVPTLHE